MRRIDWVACGLAAVVGCAAAGVLATRPGPAARAAGEGPKRAASPPQTPPPEPTALGFSDDDDLPPPKTVVRFYDVSDLVRDVPEHPFDSGVVPPTLLGVNRHGSFSGGGGGGGQGLFGAPPNDRPAKRPDAITVDGLINLVKSFVDAEDWRDEGGSVGSIQVVEHMLVIRQTDEAHRQVAALLADLRQSRSRDRGVDVQAYWVLVAPGELKAILKDDGRGGAAGAGREVDLAVLERLGEKALFTRGAISCLSGQTVHVLSGRARTVVRDLNASVGTGASAYDPEMADVLAGTLLRLTPHVQGDVAVVDLAAATGDWHEPGKPAHFGSQYGTVIPATQPSDVTIATRVEMSADVDRLNVTASHLATTARVPLGRPVLVGGMTLEPTANGDAKAGDARQLYLVLQVTAKDPANAPAAAPDAGKGVGR